MGAGEPAVPVPMGSRAAQAVTAVFVLQTALENTVGMTAVEDSVETVLQAKLVAISSFA